MRQPQRRGVAVARAARRSPLARMGGPRRQPPRFACPNGGPAPAHPARPRRRIAAMGPSPPRRPFPRRSTRRNGRAPAPPCLRHARAARRRHATAVPDLRAGLKSQEPDATRESRCRDRNHPQTPRRISIRSAGSVNRLTQNRGTSLPNPGVFTDRVSLKTDGTAQITDGVPRHHLFNAVRPGWKPFARCGRLYYFLAAGGTDSFWPIALAASRQHVIIAGIPERCRLIARNLNGSLPIAPPAAAARCRRFGKATPTSG